MTRIFTVDGASVPITVIDVQPLGVDGFTAGPNKHMSKARAGQFAKAGAALMESELTVSLFSPGQKIDVTGKSKGKGFQGAVKRWHFSTQDKSHGNSLSHRAPGSIGQCQTPGRVFKGKKMAGKMGNARVTVQNLSVVRVDVERNLLMIKGAVPGAPGSVVIVRPAVKAQG